MALAQCAETLRSLNLPTQSAVNTAVAAQRLAAATDGATAVLASEAAARPYGLAILRRAVHYLPAHSPRFRVIGLPGAGPFAPPFSPAFFPSRPVAFSPPPPPPLFRSLS